MGQLILVRHGQSEWNKKNIFTGWVDIPLSAKGVEEALSCGKKIAPIPIHVIFVSTLARARLTAMIAMSQHDEGKVPCIVHEGDDRRAEWGKIYEEKTLKEMIPVYSSWHLNERMYGALQGRNKDECRREYGEEQVQIWRRSFDIAPPEGESLKMCSERTLPYFKEKVIPYLEKGENVLISAHGNSLRAIVMMLDKLSEKEIVSLEIPTGQPIIYTYEDQEWKKHKT
ncbi:MAG: 2,3-bisphosphoglycerate-dependent phosphoglycerate mutase [Simkaniaceae bacterium]